MGLEKKILPLKIIHIFVLNCANWELLMHWRTPKLLNGFKCESKLKTTKEQIIEARFLAHNTLKG